MTLQHVGSDSILSKIHSELPGSYAILSSIPDVVGICLPITPNANFAGKTLSSISLPSWCKVAFIQRRNANDDWETLRPSPSKPLMEDDKLTIFLPPDRVEDLEKKFNV